METTSPTSRAKDIEIQKLRAASNWQPIETAPKQRVVLLWALTDEETGNWKMATGFWMPGYRDEPGEWEWDGRRLKPYDVQPTHWMPLPEPPAHGGQ